jgi:hypothetical protein
MKNSIILALLIFGFSACKKDKTTSSTKTNGGGNTNTQAYVKFKADGVQYQYNFGTSFLDNEVEQLGFSYNNGNASDLNSLIMIYDDQDPLGLSTYTFKENSMNSIIWKKSSTDKDNNEYFLFPTGGPKGNATVTITKMKLLPGATENLYTINGTFEGKLYNNNGASIQITEGEFFNPLTN